MLRDDSLTPDAVDPETFLGLPPLEAMSRFQLTRAQYDRACRDIEGVASVRHNRETQLGIKLPAVVHLGTTSTGMRLDLHKSSGLVLPSKAGALARIRGPRGRY